MLRDKIIEIFVNVDDFCKEIAPELEKQFIQEYSLGKRNRKAGLCNSEIITLMIAFHYSQFTNLKSFYVHFAQPHLRDLFPGLVSYNRFVELQPGNKSCSIPLGNGFEANTLKGYNTSVKHLSGFLKANHGKADIEVKSLNHACIVNKHENF
ncbi:hypothetical protein IDJ77_08235 [Mucilaginibacter sp. ZT4R22]|uniref:DDE family transposase n=1 Tax=Mucilaginibacter pankratovii TaxID=2772110 RepID=A0ABR7WRA6_9SPHI|nr:hypothetical protein [Mucilaginibacter pankratovii]MBD1363797.1 hypothetical protein [Mucilaginibacter pankratovii]